MPGFLGSSHERPSRAIAAAAPADGWWNTLRVDALVIVALFAASRVLFHLLGGRFDSSTLTYFFQFADPELLRHDFSRTIWYFHAQPPLFNIAIGLILHLPPRVQGATFHIALLFLGLALLLSMRSLLGRLGVPRAWAMAFTAVFIVNPTLILFENQLFYPSVVAALLVVGFAALSRWVDRGGRISAIGAFAAFTAVVLMRSTFHPLWLAAIGVAAIAPSRQQRVFIVSLVTAAFLVGLLPYVRNVLVADQFSGSTWAGMNLARVIMPSISPAERQRGVDAGRLSLVAVIAPFSELTSYPPSVLAPDRPGDPPVLSQARKSTGAVNLNQRSYVGISALYRRDAMRLISDHPLMYIEIVALNVLWFANPAWHSPSALQAGLLPAQNIKAIGSWIALWDRTIYGRWWWGADSAGYRTLPYASLLFVPLTFLAALVVSWRLWTMRRTGGDTVPACAVLLPILFTIAYVVAVTSLLERGENNRFRVEVEPLMWVVLCSGSYSSWRWLSGMPPRPATPPHER